MPLKGNPLKFQSWKIIKYFFEFIRNQFQKNHHHLFLKKIDTIYHLKIHSNEKPLTGLE